MPGARSSYALDAEGAAAITRPARQRQGGFSPAANWDLAASLGSALIALDSALGAQPVKTLTLVLTALVALEHLGFLGLEMFAWTLPLGQTTFHTSPDFAKATQALAARPRAAAGSPP